MILLDTNVVSENFRVRRNPEVSACIDLHSADQLYICAPVLAELRYGAERLPPSRNQDYLRSVINQIETDLFAGRILPFDAAAASHYGLIVAQREKAGQTMQLMDALIAAIALANGATLATRNLRDFANLGLELINPFTSDDSQ